MRDPLRPCHHRFVSKRTAPALLIAAAVPLCGVTSTVAAQPAYSFRNPFNPQQCERAIRAGKQALAQQEWSAGARMLLAEGLLCRGLEDDPRALDAAAEMLRRIVAEEASNFFAQLELADALRKRFPLSDEAQAALRRARAGLDASDLGAARQALTDYIDENLAAMAQQRAVILPPLRSRAEALESGTLSASDLADSVILLSESGPDGIDQAERGLDVYLALHPGDALGTLYRAEILRLEGQGTRSLPLYAEAEKRLCVPGAAPSSQCSLARWRLKQQSNDHANLGPDALASPRD
jgi:tetratricopeptide (TPR) repeat protein